MKKSILFFSIVLFSAKSFSCVGPIISVNKDTAIIVSKICCGNVIDDGLLDVIDKLKVTVMQGSFYLSGYSSFNCCNSASLVVAYSDTLITIAKVDSDTGKMCTCLCYSQTILNFLFKAEKIHLKYGIMDTIISASSEIPSKYDFVNVTMNSSNGILKIGMGSSVLTNSRFSLFDISGIKVKNLNLLKNENLIDIRELKSGLYFYQIENKEWLVKSGKIIINHL